MRNSEKATAKTDPQLLRRARAMLTIRTIAVLYAGYMLYQVISAYAAGGKDAPGVKVLLAAIFLLGGGAAALAVWSVFLYRRDKRRALLDGMEEPNGAAGEAPEEAAGEAPEEAAGEAPEEAAGEAPEEASGEAPDVKDE